MVDYNFSKNTFPTNGKLQQHTPELKEDDKHFECAILAGHILGVTCNDTVMSGDRQLDEDRTYFQITPEPDEARTDGERKDFEAFNEYFYKNYGKHKDRCYFDTPHEAFYNVVKAWHIWKHILTEDEKEKFRSKW